MLNSSNFPARLLKGGAGLSLLIGLTVAAWLVDKAIRYPAVQASQFGYSAPLWIPTRLFVLLCTGASTYVFWRAARRAEAGEDLFAQRHRRRPGEKETPK